MLCFLAAGVQPSEILAVSFTNAAADEMTSRIKKLVKQHQGVLPPCEGEGGDVKTCTFHSAALAIIRDNAARRRLSSSVRSLPSFPALAWLCPKCLQQLRVCVCVSTALRLVETRFKHCTSALRRCRG